MSEAIREGLSKIAQNLANETWIDEPAEIMLAVEYMEEQEAICAKLKNQLSELQSLLVACDDVSCENTGIGSGLHDFIDGNGMQQQSERLSELLEAARSGVEPKKSKREIAQMKLREAETAWHIYFADCELGPERIWASEVYNNVRLSSRVSMGEE